MKHLEDLFLNDKTLESEYKNQDHWAKFLLDNKNERINKENYDKDLIEDFDYINKKILDKCTQPNFTHKEEKIYTEYKFPSYKRSYKK